MATGDLFSKRAVAVLDAPAETPVPEKPRKPRAKKNLLAIGGADTSLRAGHVEGFSLGARGAGQAHLDDARLNAKLGSRGAIRLRFRRGLVPTSTWGWVASSIFLLAGVGAAAGGVFAAAHFLRADARFRVPSSASIQTVGNTHLTRAQLLSVFGEDVERNIFTVSLKDRRTELESLPWVEHATVMRLLPNKIRVAIVERTPVAFARQGSQIGLVDASGVLLDMPLDAPGNPQYSFPVVTGLSADQPLETRAARMKVYRGFTADLDSAGGKISQTLSEVDLSDPEDVKALIPSGRADVLVHFGDKDFLDRYKKFEQHLPEWINQYPKLGSVDMRYERQVVLEMQAGTSVPVVAGSASSDAPAGTEAMKPAKAAPAKPAAKAPAVKGKPGAKPSSTAKAAPAKPAPASSAPATPVKTAAPPPRVVIAPPAGYKDSFAVPAKTAGKPTGAAPHPTQANPAGQAVPR